MGISPRSRWSNRDESSYKEQRSGTKSGIRPRTSKWAEPFADVSASILIIGQLTSLATLAMIHAGKYPDSGSLENASWSLGESAFLVTGGFGIASFLFLFRVSLSRKAPRRRKRMARIWLLSFLLATQLT
ncbi:MAG: hypothetical protein CM15mP105_2560 [Methanobacteriota archaeon]|nr:MAG: hypothetical protein CM15mP105_2560 [Euryarchaeota archaeon]